MTVGERIRQRRKELNLSVEEVAKRLNKNRATVYRYESDDIENLPITIIKPLADVLETTPSYLMGWANNSESTLKEETYYITETTSSIVAKNSAQYSVDDRFSRLKKYMDLLNDDGKEEAIKRIKELSYNPSYRSTLGMAAHENQGATEEEKQSDIDMITGEDF